MNGTISQLVEQYPVRYQSQIQEIFETRQRINDLMIQQGKMVKITLEKQDEKLKEDNFHIMPANNYAQRTRDGIVSQRIETMHRIYKRRGGK